MEYVGIVRSMALYGAPVWAMAVRVVHGYRTISYEAACVLAGSPPWDLEAKALVSLYRWREEERARGSRPVQRQIALRREELRQEPELQVKLEKLTVYKCDRCIKVFPSLSDLMKHMSYHDQQFLSHVVSAHVVVTRAKIFKCDDCPKRFCKNSEMLLHKLQHIKENVRNQRKLSNLQPSTDILKPYKCPDCDFKFAAESTLEAHSIVHLPFPHICKCGIGYYKLHDLKCHKKLVHGTKCEDHDNKKNILVPNNLCTKKQAKQPHSNKYPKLKTTKIKQAKNKWKAKLTDDNSDRKVIKPKSSPNPDIYIRKTDDNRYECPVCKKTLKQRSNVYIHYRIHTGERPYSCHLCEKRFTQHNVLVNHINGHATEKTYVCQHCPKSFTTAIYRDRHEFIHSDLKPYECPYCNKGFNDPSALVRHKRTHTGDKRYNCPYCIKAFSDVSAYHRHKLLHEEVKKRFECDICRRKFYQLTYLRSHMRLHHSERNFCCDYCKKLFSRKNYLKLHIQRVHTNTINRN